MLRLFLSKPNTVGRLFVILLIGGSIIYAFAFDGFVVDTTASCCCGGGETDETLSPNLDSDSEAAAVTCTRTRGQSKKCKLSNGAKCTHNCKNKKRCSFSQC